MSITWLLLLLMVIGLLLFLLLRISGEEPAPDGLPETEEAFGWAVKDSSGVLSPFKFSRRATRPRDVKLKVLYCGICHSDLHMAKNELGTSSYPMVPGHEIVGVVTEVGSKVTKVKVGDKVGVGSLVGSCRKCKYCVRDLENYCHNAIFTYNSTDSDGTATYGGYSDVMVADEHFVVQWPENLPADAGAPLLRAGITTYSALRYFGWDRPGQKVGVVGLGGLGHMAVKFAKAFGAEVTVISTSAGKRKDAIDALGADAFLLSQDTEEMRSAAGSLDGVINTVSAAPPVQQLINLLKTDGTLVMLGLTGKSVELQPMPLEMGRKAVAGSVIGGMKETQEMIDFAAEHNIVANVEIIEMDYVNEAMERLEEGKVKFRFVIKVGKSTLTID